MKAEILARELRAIAKRGGGFGSDVEQALEVLAEALEAQPEKTIDQLVAKLKPRGRRASIPKSTTFDEPAEGEVARYLEQLKAARNANDGAEVLKELSRSGKAASATAPQIKEIAGRFLGARITFKTKSDALAAIKERLERKDWDQGVIRSIIERANA